MWAALCLAGSVSTLESACATEYGLGDYLLGYNLPMAGYTPPPGVYFSDTFYLYEGSANANITFPLGRNTAAGLSYNFLFDIDQVAWVTDVKVLGGSLGSRRWFHSAVSALRRVLPLPAHWVITGKSTRPPP
jgi:hypothetical protein